MMTDYRHSPSSTPPVKPKIDIEKIAKTKLPPLPESVMKVSELLRDPNVSTRKISDVVRYDPLITTRILQLANSPLYYLKKDITSLTRAIEIIGTKSLYSIIMLDITANSFAKELSNTEVGQKIWEHSLAVALLAKELSNISKTGDPETGFICGLLHDIGKILLLRSDSANYLNILKTQDEMEMMRLEYEIYGYNHAQVGGLVIRRWNLPDDVCHVILNHHNASDSRMSIVTAHHVALADLIANINGCGLRREAETSLLFSESAISLGIDENAAKGAWIYVQQSLGEVIKMF